MSSGRIHPPHGPARPWTPEEDEMVLAFPKDAQEVAEILERTVKAVHMRRYTLNNPHYLLQAKHRKQDLQTATERTARHAHEPWDEWEDLLVIDPERPSDVELAQRLGRTIAAVRTRRRTIMEREQGQVS